HLPPLRPRPRLPRGRHQLRLAHRRHELPHPRRGLAYTHICRIYPDGGGVYTAAKSRSQILAVVGALLLFADYTVTASLSAVDAFHYFGLGHQEQAAVETHD